MSGRHKWSDLKRRAAPEHRLRVEIKKAELRATLPPRTYAQIRWAAMECESGPHGYNRYFRDVYQPDFRTSLIHGCSESDAKRLLRFLNRWKSPTWAKLDVVLSDTLPEVLRHLGPLVKLDLDEEKIDLSVFTGTERAFDTLTSLQYIGPTTASRILAVLNPGFFVMWDSRIQKEYFHWEQRNGHAYQEFIKEMRKSALSVVEDSRKYGIDDPAGSISEDICQRPPFTLAKFINDYVWLTVTRREQYPYFLNPQE